MLKNKKFWIVVAICAILAITGIWYANTHPDQVKPPPQVEGN